MRISSAPASVLTFRRPIVDPPPVRRGTIDTFERQRMPSLDGVPKLGDVFDLVDRTPGKVIQLDTKLPEDEPLVAKRMARQYMQLFAQHPGMSDRVFIACNDPKMLNVMQDEFARSRDWSGFKNFSRDHEELNDFFIGGDVNDADPLKGSRDNRYVSIGDPRAPLRVGGFDDVLALTEKTLKKTRDPSSRHFGKKLVVWTINAEDKMRQLAKLKPDFIVTDQPALLKKVLDEVCGDDALQPKIQCHRGGPDGCGYAENTLPMIRKGLQVGDSIEFDVCSAIDGPVVFHDNDPYGVVGVLRNLGVAGDGEFRPTNPEIGSPLRGRRIDELTVRQVQDNFGYQKR